MSGFDFDWDYVEKQAAEQKKRRKAHGWLRAMPETTRSEYQHEYYMRITKKRRAERKKT